MSRIGNRKLAIPAGVTVEVNGSEVTVKSSKGELKTTVSSLIEVKVSEGFVETIQKNPSKTLGGRIFIVLIVAGTIVLPIAVVIAYMIIAFGK